MKKIGHTTYTYLMFLDSGKVKRVSYEYDAKLVKAAHHFPKLVRINVLLIILISFIYTLTITKPINRIIAKILMLSDGHYLEGNVKSGIYLQIEKCLIQLSERLKSNEEERNQLEKTREEWISNISHDIKTPLTSIMGNAEIMADIDYEIDDEIREKCCHTIISKSEYIKTLVEELNLSTRLKNNDLVLNRKTVNIVSLVRHVVIDIINDQKYSNRHIHFNYNQEDILVDVDEQLMKRVFINLIINALIHNTDDVEVGVTIQKAENRGVSITIEDNGKGVSEEELENIFRRYYRGISTNRKIEGSGLGMAIAHDIIKAHGAEITAVRRLGEGMKIIIKYNKI